MKIQQYRINPGRGMAALELVTQARRELGAGEARVAVRSISLNARDFLIADGHYGVPADPAVVLCSDGAGVVTEAAPGSPHRIGDRVAGSFFRDWLSGPATLAAISTSFGCQLDGWLSTEVVMPAEALVRIPDALSFSDAACAPCAGVTAWNALFDFAQLAPGSSVLVQGTGGVATWAAQLAAAAGMRCLVTSSSDERLARISQVDGLAGAGLINYKTYPEWAAEVLRLTDGQGVDLILELGGHDTIVQSLQAAAFGGRIAVIGGLSGWQYPPIPPLDLVKKQILMRGMHVGSRSMLQSLLKFSAEHRLKPVVSKTFGFDRVHEAFAAARESGHVGKIVIAVE
jgi:NADPH:quinone reductase-like Zn-dependent oxidoreductase